jgi:hypothetical protein
MGGDFFRQTTIKRGREPWEGDGDKGRDGKLLVNVCRCGTLRLFSLPLMLKWILIKIVCCPNPRGTDARE